MKHQGQGTCRQAKLESQAWRRCLPDMQSVPVTGYQQSQPHRAGASVASCGYASAGICRLAGANGSCDSPGRPSRSSMSSCLPTPLSAPQAATVLSVLAPGCLWRSRIPGSHRATRPAGGPRPPAPIPHLHPPMRGDRGVQAPRAPRPVCIRSGVSHKVQHTRHHRQRRWHNTVVGWTLQVIAQRPHPTRQPLPRRGLGINVQPHTVCPVQCHISHITGFGISMSIVGQSVTEMIKCGHKVRKRWRFGHVTGSECHDQP